MTFQLFGTFNQPLQQSGATAGAPAHVPVGKGVVQAPSSRQQFAALWQQPGVASHVPVGAGHQTPPAPLTPQRVSVQPGTAGLGHHVPVGQSGRRRGEVTSPPVSSSTPLIPPASAPPVRTRDTLSAHVPVGGRERREGN